MQRLVLPAILAASAIGAFAQSSTQPAISDPAAVNMAQKSVAVLTNGVAVNDVSLSANVTWIAGSDNETGSGTFQAKGIGSSRIDLNLSNGTRTDVRDSSTGTPTGAWAINGASGTPYAGHNCWTDAAWFFPALTSLSQTSNPGFVFKYVGPEQHSGVSVEHIRAFQALQPDWIGTIQRLSTVDFYLDASSYLPIAIDFKTHADNNMNTDLAVEVDFANYQVVNGTQIPFHVQKLVNGTVTLDVVVTSAALNTGLVGTAFTLN